MRDGWLKPDYLFDNGVLSKNLGLQLVDGSVACVGPAPVDAARVAGCLTVGFVDLQVNGGGGVLVNNDPSLDGLRAIATAHRKLGTTAIIPTVITDAPDVLEHAATAAMAAAGEASILGLHIEGPHIAASKRGTHKADFIRPLDERTTDIIEKLCHVGITVKITLAPEAATPAQIKALTKMGALVSLGHTNADATQIKASIAAGAQCATHLFNAMSQMTGRAPNAVGAILNSDIYAGIICDGHHVSDDMIALAMRSRPLDHRMFIVSDAMATIGGPDTFTLYGQGIRLRDGRLINAEGNLAGAHTTVAQGVQRLVQHVGVPLQQALRMATTVPCALVKRPDLARMTGRPDRDILRLDHDLNFTGTLANN